MAHSLRGGVFESGFVCRANNTRMEQKVEASTVTSSKDGDDCGASTTLSAVPLLRPWVRCEESIVIRRCIGASTNDIWSLNAMGPASPLA